MEFDYLKKYNTKREHVTRKEVIHLLMAIGYIKSHIKLNYKKKQICYLIKELIVITIKTKNGF